MGVFGVSLSNVSDNDYYDNRRCRSSVQKGLAPRASRLVDSYVMENWISLKQAAEILEVSVEAVRRLCHRATLGHRRMGGQMFVHVVEVRRRASERPASSRARRR